MAFVRSLAIFQRIIARAKLELRSRDISFRAAGIHFRRATAGREFAYNVVRLRLRLSNK